MNYLLNDIHYMRRALELGALGIQSVAPNPMVGAVIVHKNTIIGEGYHQKHGEPHAEVNAVQQVKDKELLKESTIYVTLEPCCHHGKTPPCADLIIKYKIPRVVISTFDPFPEVAGSGIERLKKAGVEVVTGVLEQEGRELNKRFFTFHEKKRPYIALKWAESADGFIDKIRMPGEPIGPNWITGKTAQMLVHKWRSEEMGILVGTNTVIIDDPKLNVREWSGKSPIRIILDRQMRIPETAKVYSGSEKTLIYNQKLDFVQKNVQGVKLDMESDNLNSLLAHLYALNIISVMVEGGGLLHHSFIQQGLWDEIRIFRGDKVFGKGVLAPKVDHQPQSFERFSSSTLFIYRNNFQ